MLFECFNRLWCANTQFGQKPLCPTCALQKFIFREILFFLLLSFFGALYWFLKIRNARIRRFRRFNLNFLLLFFQAQEDFLLLLGTSTSLCRCKIFFNKRFFNLCMFFYVSALPYSAPLHCSLETQQRSATSFLLKSMHLARALATIPRKKATHLYTNVVQIYICTFHLF